MPGSGRRRAAIVAVAAAVVVVDQVSKTWALHHTTPARHVVGPLWLTLTFNTGAAFGLGRGVTPVVEAVVVLIVVALLVVGRRITSASPRAAVAGTGLLLGGAVGNLADRVIRHHGGAVIDFIDVARVGTHDYWPVFNLADSAVVIGAVLTALALSARSRTPVRATP